MGAILFSLLYIRFIINDFWNCVKKPLIDILTLSFIIVSILTFIYGNMLGKCELVNNKEWPLPTDVEVQSCERLGLYDRVDNPSGLSGEFSGFGQGFRTLTIYGPIIFIIILLGWRFKDGNYDNEE